MESPYGLGLVRVGILIALGAVSPGKLLNIEMAGLCVANKNSHLGGNDYYERDLDKSDLLSCRCILDDSADRGAQGKPLGVGASPASGATCASRPPL